MSGSNFSEGFWCGQNIFSNIKKLKNSNKKVEKLQKLINEVQKKTSKTEKTKGVLMPKSIECAPRKYEKVDIHKNKQSYRILQYTVFSSGQRKCS